MFAFAETKRIRNRSEEIRKSGLHPYVSHPLKEDMELLESVKSQSIQVPLFFTVIATPVVLIAALRMQLPRYFQNPLSSNYESHIKKVRAFKIGFASNIILAISALSLGGAQLKYYLTKYWMYNEYKHLVDRYKVLRDQETMDQIIRQNRQ